MRLEVPAWWYGGAQSAPALLAPIAAVYGAVSGRRMARPPAYRSALPVICLGNFTAGGGGKTPAAIALARMLIAAGESPAILSRGYGGRQRGPVDVNPGDSADEIGDEPLILAEAARTIVAADRPAGARRAENTGASVIVMDDGFQSPNLAKDLCLVCVDAGAGVGNGRVMPAGPLRAPLDRQLEQASAILLIGDGDRAAPVLKAAAERKLPVLKARIEPIDDPRWLTVLPVIGFAGIARPQKFFVTLKKHARVIECVPFADHHRYRAKDAEDLLRRAAEKKAMLVTTEKDWVRLPQDDGPLGELRHKSRPLNMRLVLEKPELMQKLLGATLTRVRAAAATSA
jgi:tetraacyldisaccharide 4'-kinase